MSRLTRLTGLFVLASLTASHSFAAPLPPHTSGYAGNLKTLQEDQKAPLPVAECLANAYEIVHHHSKWDRFGFTDEDVAGAVTSAHSGDFSTEDKRQVNSVIVVGGDARTRGVDGGWQDIEVRCGLENDKLVAIEVNPAA